VAVVESDISDACVYEGSVLALLHDIDAITSLTLRVPAMLIHATRGIALGGETIAGYGQQLLIEAARLAVAMTAARPRPRVHCGVSNSGKQTKMA
jgi:hypothetical protein